MGSPIKERIPEAVFCYEHDQWECYFIDELEDPPETRTIKCCHREVKKKNPFCKKHNPHKKQ